VSQNAWPKKVESGPSEGGRNSGTFGLHESKKEEKLDADNGVKQLKGLKTKGKKYRDGRGVEKKTKLTNRIENVITKAVQTWKGGKKDHYRMALGGGES